MESSKAAFSGDNGASPARPSVARYCRPREPAKANTPGGMEALAQKRGLDLDRLDLDAKNALWEAVKKGAVA